jgi:hypothetical protein
MTKKNTIFLIIGITLIFLSLYLFTKPAFFDSWDFSNTGQIGDTIGGITAPIINLLGAFLVYTSFQEQLRANRIQVQALNDEKERNTYDRVFNNYISLYESLKSHLENLEFIVKPSPNYARDGSITSVNHIVYKGLNAINEFVIRIEDKEKYRSENYEVYGILLSFQFILKSLSELSNLVESNIILTNDKAFLSQNIKLMYDSFLRGFADRVIKVYDKDDPYIKDLIKIKEELDKKHSG